MGTSDRVEGVIYVGVCRLLSRLIGRQHQGRGSCKQQNYKRKSKTQCGAALVLLFSTVG